MLVILHIKRCHQDWRCMKLSGSFIILSDKFINHYYPMTFSKTNEIYHTDLSWIKGIKEVKYLQIPSFEISSIFTYFWEQFDPFSNRSEQCFALKLHLIIFPALRFLFTYRCADLSFQLNHHYDLCFKNFYTLNLTIWILKYFW